MTQVQRGLSVAAIVGEHGGTEDHVIAALLPDHTIAPRQPKGDKPMNPRWLLLTCSRTRPSLIVGFGRFHGSRAQE